MSDSLNCSLWVLVYHFCSNRSFERLIFLFSCFVALVSSWEPYPSWVGPGLQNFDQFDTHWHWLYSAQKICLGHWQWSLSIAVLGVPHMHCSGWSCIAQFLTPFSQFNSGASVRGLTWTFGMHLLCINMSQLASLLWGGCCSHQLSAILVVALVIP